MSQPSNVPPAPCPVPHPRSRQVLARDLETTRAHAAGILAKQGATPTPAIPDTVDAVVLACPKAAQALIEAGYRRAQREMAQSSPLAKARLLWQSNEALRTKYRHDFGLFLYSAEVEAHLSPVELSLARQESKG